MADTTYSYARDHLAEVWDEAEQSQTPIIIQRRGHQNMALIPADELSSLRETAHLLRSPRNAARLLAAMVRSAQGTVPPVEIEELRRELDVGDER